MSRRKIRNVYFVNYCWLKVCKVANTGTNDHLIPFAIT